VFDFWKEQLDHPKAQLTPDRKRKIEERLSDSTVDEIHLAIKGCRASDFHMGREPGHPQKFDDIELICRKRSKLESFIALAPKTNGKPPKIEDPAERLRRESCPRCHATGTEIVEGKGARPCNHGISNPNSQTVESLSAIN
jgi:hypothetical protein